VEYLITEYNSGIRGVQPSFHQKFLIKAGLAARIFPELVQKDHSLIHTISLFPASVLEVG
jgi:hypothetical protein